ncbi:galactokinase [Mariniluteicoccus flavus]
MPQNAVRTDLPDLFRELIGGEPDGQWAAPGRVNLIGEHTDYNAGFVLPFALDREVRVAARLRDDETWTFASTGQPDAVTVTVDDLQPGSGGWAAYLAGVVWALREAGHTVRGADLLVDSTVPVGAGLSSSAALECATLVALADLSGLQISPMDGAQLARRAENAYVGAPTGLMDQAASMLCTADHALLLDCDDLSTRSVPLALGDAGLELLVLDTNTPHALVDSAYADRRRSCEDAAALLGVPDLRAITSVDGLERTLADDEMLRRVRHVVTENARVLEAVECLDQGRTRDLAPLLDASHASMRDDFEITVPTVDLAVETARTAGAHGARMTGGGFGGCIIALCDLGTAGDVEAAIAQSFADAGFRAPAGFVPTPAAGARRVG